MIDRKNLSVREIVILNLELVALLSEALVEET